MTVLILFGGMETLASDGSVDAAKKAFKEGNYIARQAGGVPFVSQTSMLCCASQNR